MKLVKYVNFVVVQVIIAIHLTRTVLAEILIALVDAEQPVLTIYNVIVVENVQATLVVITIVEIVNAQKIVMLNVMTIVIVLLVTIATQ